MGDVLAQEGDPVADGVDGAMHPPWPKLPPGVDAGAGIEAALLHDLSNARVEAINSRLRFLTRIALAMLSLGGSCPPLPGRSRWPCQAAGPRTSPRWSTASTPRRRLASASPLESCSGTGSRVVRHS